MSSTVRHRSCPALAIFTAALLSGCAGAYSSNRAGESRNVITREQILESNVLNAFDAVRRLRPNWLRTRVSAMGTPPPVRVYVDGVSVGNADYLSNVRIDIIQRLVYYSPADATTKWGTGHAGGAIEVVTRR